MPEPEASFDQPDDPAQVCEPGPRRWLVVAIRALLTIGLALPTGAAIHLWPQMMPLTVVGFGLVVVFLLRHLSLVGSTFLGGLLGSLAGNVLAGRWPEHGLTVCLAAGVGLLAIAGALHARYLTTSEAETNV